jgi:putative spermidine/putrescine transport system ATP-binding protein
MTAPAISLRGLSKHYDQVRAVDDLDLDIADGEFFSMLVPRAPARPPCCG